MKDKDKNIEEAIDNIFGEDVLTINTDSDDSNDNDLSKTSLNIYNYENSDIDLSKLDDETKNQLENDHEALDNYDTNDEKSTDEQNESNNVMSLDSSSDDDIEVEKQTDLNGKRKGILIILLCAILLVIVILILFIYNLNCEKNVSCVYSVNDKNFVLSDTVKITYKKDKISYVNGNYSYAAITKDFKDQIDNIRQEKIPVIVNSNGMKGFTYILNEENDKFSITSSLDFTSFDYDEISKIDQKTKPISYFEIDSNLTYKKLKNILEKQGYTCKKSK